MTHPNVSAHDVRECQPLESCVPALAGGFVRIWAIISYANEKPVGGFNRGI
ncbi:MAG: hypothetical protein OHK0012_01050 [Synechococcales cyanobacterium]